MYYIEKYPGRVALLFVVVVCLAAYYFALAPIAESGNENMPYNAYYHAESGNWVFLSESGDIAVNCPCEETCGTLYSGGPYTETVEIEPEREAEEETPEGEDENPPSDDTPEGEDEPVATPSPTPDDDDETDPTPSPTPEDEEDDTPEPTRRPRCNQGVGNGSEGCSPGNSDKNQPPNDEGPDDRPGNPGRRGGRGRSKDS